MSSFKTLALLCTLALAGCGFAPVYGPDGGASGLSGSIEVDPPRDTEGFALVRRLEDRLGLATAPAYTLSADIRLSEVARGITIDQIITRYHVRGQASYRLRDAASGEILTSGDVSNFTAYATTGTPVATQSAQADARERLMAILADQIVAELLATAPDWRP